MEFMQTFFLVLIFFFFLLFLFGEARPGVCQRDFTCKGQFNGIAGQGTSRTVTTIEQGRETYEVLASETK